MTGLFLIAVFGAWVWFALWLTKKITRGIKKTSLRNIATVVLVIALLSLPVADELIAAPQFNKLCAEDAVLKFDPERIRGRTIFLADDQQPQFTVGTLHGHYIPGRYLDATTKELLITDTSYHLEGGIFIRMLGISETKAPLTLRSYCASPESPWQKTFLSRYNLKYIQPKDVK